MQTGGRDRPVARRDDDPDRPRADASERRTPGRLLRRDDPFARPGRAHRAAPVRLQRPARRLERDRLLEAAARAKTRGPPAEPRRTTDRRRSTRRWKRSGATCASTSAAATRRTSPAPSPPRRSIGSPTTSGGPRAWKRRARSSSPTPAVRSRSTSATGSAPPGSTRGRRPTPPRPLEHAWPLQERAGAERIDVALVSHYHDDHVASVPLLQRVLRHRVLVPRLVQRPPRAAGGVHLPLPLADGDTGRSPPERRRGGDLGGHRIRASPMSGHTRFSAAIAFEVDGVRFAHTGDQYHVDDATQVLANHVYRNGAFLDSFANSAAWLRAWKPRGRAQRAPACDVDGRRVLRPGRRVDRGYERMHRESMVLGDDEIHFGLDSWGGWIRPYRSHLPAPAPVTVEATVRNPLPDQAELEVRSSGPSGWEGSSTRVRAEARSRGQVHAVDHPPPGHAGASRSRSSCSADGHAVRAGRRGARHRRRTGLLTRQPVRRCSAAILFVASSAATL